MYAGLTPPDHPLSDGIVTLRVPDEVRDLAAVSAPPNRLVVAQILGGEPEHAPDPATVFARYREWWDTGTNAFFSVDALGHRERVGVIRVLFGLVDPFGFAEVGYILELHGRGQGYATRAVRRSRIGCSRIFASGVFKPGRIPGTSRRSACSSGWGSNAKDWPARATCCL